MRICLPLLLLLTAVSPLAAGDNALVIKDAATIKRELTRAVLIPKGATTKGVQVVTREAQRISLPAIRFQLDSTVLADRESEHQLDELGKALADGELKNARFTLEGHTCDLGENDYNLGLSLRRAHAVKSMLIERHRISPDRLMVAGRGKTKPEVTNDSESHRVQNRRVVVIREP